MKTSAIYTIILILFLVVSIGYGVLKESKARSAPENRVNNTEVKDNPVSDTTKSPGVTHASNPGDPTSNVTKPSGTPPGVTSDQIIVYYFHGNMRCSNCIKIENYSKEAVDTGFTDALKNGVILWKVLNTDQPENEHFIKDYQLTTKSLVLVKMRDGNQLKWKNLKEVWNHLNDKDAFIKYVQDEVRLYLEEK